MKGLLNLRGISGQIAALVVVSIAALHLIITASFLLHRPDQPEPSSGHGQLATAVQLLGAAPASERPRLSADIARAFPQLGIEILPAGQVSSSGEGDRFNPHGLQRRSYRWQGRKHAQCLLRARERNFEVQHTLQPGAIVDDGAHGGARVQRRDQ